MGQKAILLLMVIQLILHGCREIILNLNMNFNDRELFVADFPIICLVALALH